MYYGIVCTICWVNVVDIDSHVDGMKIFPQYAIQLVKNLVIVDKFLLHEVLQ